MPRTVFPLLVAVVAVLLAPPAARAQLLEREVNGRVSPIPGAVIWGKGKYADVRMSVSALTPPDTITPASLLIGRDTPNGIRFRSLSLHTGPGSQRDGPVTPLPVEFGKGFVGLNEYGELKEGYFVQAAQVHLNDKEGTNLLLVAIGNGLTELSVNVFQWDWRKGMWKRVGQFTGQAKAVFGKGRVTLPYGSQGLFTEYRWRNGRFVKTN